jgi:CspA family cold shock protein
MCGRERMEQRTCFHNSLAKNVLNAHTVQVEFYLGSVRGASQAPLLVSPTDNLMLRTLSRGATCLWRDSMPTGTVKWFNPSKGFGFIQPSDKSKDVFVHISAVERAGLATLNENQSISYELEQGQNGKTSAVDLKAV